MMRRQWRWTNGPLAAAGVVFLLFCSDILAAKLQIVAGKNAPLHIGDTGQFLLLLLAVILFVIGTLKQESGQQETYANDKNRKTDRGNNASKTGGNTHA